MIRPIISATRVIAGLNVLADPLSLGNGIGKVRSTITLQYLITAEVVDSAANNRLPTVKDILSTRHQELSRKRPFSRYRFSGPLGMLETVNFSQAIADHK